jgi:hypothetical protein
MNLTYFLGSSGKLNYYATIVHLGGSKEVIVLSERPIDFKKK